MAYEACALLMSLDSLGQLHRGDPTLTQWWAICYRHGDRGHKNEDHIQESCREMRRVEGRREEGGGGGGRREEGGGRREEGRWEEEGRRGRREEGRWEEGGGRREKGGKGRE